MTRLSVVLIIVIFAFIFLPTSLEARKLLNLEKKEVPSSEDNFVGSTFVREPTKILPASDHKGHAMANKEKLFAIHLAKIDQVLQSVPSPGAGHH
ncbi:precursor of CEP14-like [Durio zibethinus]|uniref:Precursor of CEP14-like n=1 Tax=Durio zibethinus TaxID=66656 RepID=A0A6P5WPJ7_DURZI|nr:precursor of CEP14-like [Durio zibethinus]